QDETGGATNDGYGHEAQSHTLLSFHFPRCIHVRQTPSGESPFLASGRRGESSTAAGRDFLIQPESLRRNPLSTGTDIFLKKDLPLSIGKLEFLQCLSK